MACMYVWASKVLEKPCGRMGGRKPSFSCLNDLCAHSDSVISPASFTFLILNCQWGTGGTSTPSRPCIGQYCVKYMYVYICLYRRMNELGR